MKVKIDKSRKVYKGNLYSGRINENKYEVLEFEFPQELEDFTKYIEIEATDNEGTLRYADRIENNEFAIDNTLSKYSLITAQVVCKDLRENVVFKSNPFEFTFEQSLNIMEDIEEEQQDLLDRIELELQEAKEDITDLQETQEQHTEQIQTNATDIEDLQERVATNETDITNIKAKNTQQDTAIGTNTQDISNIKAEQTTQNTNITSNTNRITVLEAQSGNKVALSINSNYVMTLQLLNKENEVLSTGTIDLPIESMVVNASYSNGILTLTLQNGQTLNVDISDIVSGLVSETTFNSAISELQSSITSLQGRMTIAENNIANKVDKVTGKGLSTNDYTTEEKNKLAALENYDDTEINAEITELQAEITDLQTDLEMATDLIPTDEATGSDITINDSARYYFKKFEIEGKSEQETFTGKNLFNKNLQITNGWYNDNGELIDSSLTAHFTENIKVKPNTNYTISGYLIINLPNVNYANFSRIYFFDANQNFISRTPSITTNDYTFNTPQNCEYINFQLFNDDNYSNYKYSQSLNTFQLEEGSTATDYEPYTGGQPAPSPIYECPIQNVTGNVDVKVENKNFMSLVDASGTANNLNYSVANQKITINGTATSGRYTWMIFTKDSTTVQNGTPSASAIVNLANGKTICSGEVVKSIKKLDGTSTHNVTGNIYDENGSVVSNPTSETKIIAFAVYLGNGQTFNNFCFGLQIENGSTATDYEPHEEQTVTFPLSEGQVLHEEDTIEDKIVQRRDTIIYDGSDDEDWRRYTANVFSTKKITNKRNCLSNYFKFSAVEVASQLQNGEFCIASDANANRVLFKINDIDTLEDFKTWLSTHNVNVEYELATPIETEFTEAQATAKAQIDKLYSYKGTTHISSDNEPNPIFNVTYRKDIETMLDKINEIDARLSLLE